MPVGGKHKQYWILRPLIPEFNQTSMRVLKDYLEPNSSIMYARWIISHQAYPVSTGPGSEDMGLASPATPSSPLRRVEKLFRIFLAQRKAIGLLLA